MISWWHLLILAFLTVLPACISIRLAQAKRFYPIWPWAIAALLFSWITVVVVLMIPRRTPRMGD